MTPEQQRIKIAKACGWKLLKWTKGNREYRGWKSPEGKQCQMLPDYTADLNAMHEAEKTLTKDQKLEYQEQLFRCAYKNGEHDGCFASWHYIHASAKTRAEAFVSVIQSIKTP